MLFNGAYYQEIAVWGEDVKTAMKLVRNEEGRTLLCKRIDSSLLPIYRRLINIEHENIVTVYGITKDEYGILAVMEYFPSKTLEEKMLENGIFSIRDMKSVILQIAKGVSTIHDLGIVHRDLSANNILIDKSGRVKITDFGIARMYDKDKNADTRILGTHGYAAPEQFGFIQTDRKADVYAIGVLMNVMLSGKMPNEKLYKGDSKLMDIIQRCTSMKPSERYEVEEIVDLLGYKISNISILKRRIIKSIPGFRSGNKVKMTLAIIHYVYMILYYLMSIISSIAAKNMFNPVSILGFIGSTLGLGYFVGSFDKVAYKMNMRKGVGKILLIFAYIIIGFIIIGVSMVSMY